MGSLASQLLPEPSACLPSNYPSSLLCLLAPALLLLPLWPCWCFLVWEALRRAWPAKLRLTLWVRLDLDPHPFASTEIDLWVKCLTVSYRNQVPYLSILFRIHQESTHCSLYQTYPCARWTIPDFHYPLLSLSLISCYAVFRWPRSSFSGLMLFIDRQAWAFPATIVRPSNL